MVEIILMLINLLTVFDIKDILGVEVMMMKYMRVKDAVEKWGISERRIRKLLEEGRVKGAKKDGKIWNIPVNASKPIDKRFMK